MANQKKPKRVSASPALLIATRKGAFILRGENSRHRWKLGAPIQLGHIAHHLVQDPRERRSLLMSLRTGHLGPTMMRSRDGGRTWTEATSPPAFPKATEGQ